MTLNPLTGRYEGNGSMQSRSTQDNHVRDDERSQLISECEGLPAMSTLSSTGEPARNRYARINDEVDLLMGFPMTSFLRPLVFQNPPEENGEFIWPNPLDPPNHGVFALTNDTANRKFLSTENQLFELHTDINETHDNSEDSGALLNRIQMELGRLTREGSSMGPAARKQWNRTSLYKYRYFPPVFCIGEIFDNKGPQRSSFRRLATRTQR